MDAIANIHSAKGRFGLTKWTRKGSVTEKTGYTKTINSMEEKFLRKELYGSIEAVREALEELGYEGEPVHFGWQREYDEWRKGQRHITLRERKGTVTIHIHKDPPLHIGRIRYKGKDREVQLKLIIKTLKQPLQTIGG